MKKKYESTFCLLGGPNDICCTVCASITNLDELEAYINDIYFQVQALRLQAIPYTLAAQRRDAAKRSKQSKPRSGGK